MTECQRCGDGDRWPCRYTAGTLQFTEHLGGEVTIDVADPVVVLPHEFLDRLPRSGPRTTALYVEGFERWGDHYCREATCDEGMTCFRDTYLHIDADRKLIYRITDYDREKHAWRAAWPD